MVSNGDRCDGVHIVLCNREESLDPDLRVLMMHIGYNVEVMLL